MSTTFISYDTSDWYHDYFMMWDDPEERQGMHFWCGARCTRHTLFIKSSVKQTVRAGAHTYRFYTYPDGEGSCPVRNNDAQMAEASIDDLLRIFDDNAVANVIVNERDDEMRTFTNGDGWLPGIEMEAGEEIEVTVEFNWQR